MPSAKKKVLVTVGITALLLILRARRRMKQKQSNLSAASKRRALLAQKSTLPFFVDPDVLINGWAVAPAIYYAPSVAVVPFVRNSDWDDLDADATSPKVNASSPVRKSSAIGGGGGGGDVFILCEEMAEVPPAGGSTEDILAAYLQSNPLFGVAAAAPPRLQALQVHKASELVDKNSKTPAPGPVFTHLVADEGRSVLLLVGQSGKFVVTACLQNFAGRFENVAQSAPPAANHHHAPSGAEELQVLVQMLVDAVFAVPLTDQQRFPGTPAGACQGYYTVRCAHKDMEVQLALPTAVRVCTGAEATPSADTLLTLSYGGTKAGLTRSQVEAIAALSAGEEVALFPPAEGDAASPAPPPPPAKLVYVKAALSSAEEVTATYNQPTMGIRFPVNVRTGTVYDPLLVGTAQVLYYPQGVSAAAETAPATPLISFELLPSLPPTWETSLKGEADKATKSNTNPNSNNSNADEVLLHNVKFHFTEWEREQTPCAITEQAGHTAVHFVETKEGVTCRSLVLPRTNSILVIRCEVPSGEWASYTPFMQTFFDTLYIDNVK